MTKKIMIIAGEASGDLHAAEVVKALQSQSPDLTFFGIAGPKMRALNVEALVKTETISIMGFVEVLANIRTILRVYQLVKKAIIERKPDLLILVDYPGFNLKVAKLAKQHGIKVLYYVSPQIWAWRQGRIKKIKQCVDHMAVILPFEVELYKKYAVPVTYVGLPLLDELDFSLNQLAAREKLGLATTATTIAILPGSRSNVMKRLLPLMLSVVSKLKEQFADLQIVLPVASTLDTEIVSQQLPAGLSIKVLNTDSQLAIKASDVVITASGTATLETALLKVPMVVVYKMNSLSYQIIKSLIKIKNISLCNIVAEKTIVKEFIQADANVSNVSKEVQHILTDAGYRQTMMNDLEALRAKVGERGAAEKVATLARQMLAEEI